jgi:hypothetical protein
MPIMAHPIKMTTSKLEINSEDKTVFLSINFFIDDFEAALRKLYPQPAFNYSNPDDYLIMTLNNYINKCFRLTADTNVIVFKYYSLSKMEGNVCQVILLADYAEFKSVKKLTVSNSLLFESYRTQSNILHVFNNSKSSQILQFYPSDDLKVLKL